jgi:hypothetical protein
VVIDLAQVLGSQSGNSEFALTSYTAVSLPSTDAAQLARWTRFAAKGGIGKCTAIEDCVAESPEDLMFLKVRG